MAQPLVSLQHVSKSYGGHRVIDDVTAEIAAGELVLLRGESGSGKTTLLSLIGLLELPTEGTVLVEGRDASELSPDERARTRLRLIGHVFQSHNMIPSLSIEDNVALPLKLAGRPDRARAAALLARVELTPRAQARPDEVSVGERQRAAFARALANRPALLLADEPTASLDEANAARIADALLAARAEGAAVVVASHDPRLWDRLPKARSWWAEAGRIRAE